MSKNAMAEVRKRIRDRLKDRASISGRVAERFKWHKGLRVVTADDLEDERDHLRLQLWTAKLPWVWRVAFAVRAAFIGARG